MIYRNVVIDGENLSGEESFDAGRNWYPFMATVRLFRISLVLSVPGHWFKRIWECADGFGVDYKGEYDWSGIRDSSEAALEKMDAIAKEQCPDEILHMIVRPVETQLH